MWDGASTRWKVQTRKWNSLIDAAGEMAGVPNPRIATREDCWGDGSMGNFSEAVTGKRINSGASVLNPFLCECLFRLYCPNENVDTPQVFDVFAGGVQFGFVSAFQNEGMPQASYRGIELRQNQCDANNKICRAFDLDAKWICGDAVNASEVFGNETKDLFFSCPPYFGIETYRNQNGKVDHRCANAQDTYKGYFTVIKYGLYQAINILKENRFGCIMVGDTRNKHGVYYGTIHDCESLLRETGCKIWQRIYYQEPMGLRGITANRSSHASRKLGNTVQVILVFYKGNTKNIPNFFGELK
jgi:hypothetical protein